MIKRIGDNESVLKLIELWIEELSKRDYESASCLLIPSSVWSPEAVQEVIESYGSSGQSCVTSIKETKGGLTPRHDVNGNLRLTILVSWVKFGSICLLTVNGAI